MPADLHIHTTISDGTHTPEEVVRLAKEAGLKTIAITDHDIIDGVERAIEAGQKAGVEVIPGVEFTTESPKAEIHILGYFIDRNDPEFLAALEKVQQGRVKRIYKIVEKLNSLGVDLSAEEVLAIAGNKAPGRPHVARALLKKGVVANFKDAFNRFLDSRSPAYVPHYKLTPTEAIKLISAAGGLPVFAHPLISNADGMIAEFAGIGLKGIEVYYPGYRPEVIGHYLELARKMGLCVTGGTDFHGEGSGREIKLGELTIADELVDKLKNEHLHRN
ncbi:MAG: PHP domain-containing protein [bacterium]